MPNFGHMARLSVRKGVLRVIYSTFRVLYDVGITNLKFVRGQLFFLVHKKTSREAKNKNMFFGIISRLRKDTTFLSPDLESTQNSASYRMF